MSVKHWLYRYHLRSCSPFIKLFIKARTSYHKNSWLIVKNMHPERFWVFLENFMFHLWRNMRNYGGLLVPFCQYGFYIAQYNSVLRPVKQYCVLWNNIAFDNFILHNITFYCVFQKIIAPYDLYCHLQNNVAPYNFILRSITLYCVL